jgi:MFS family permease
VGNPALGFLADRFGHKLSMELGLLALTLGFAIAWLAPAPEWYYVAFALFGVVSGALFVSGILIVMEFSGPERRPTYVGIANTGVGIVGALAPLLGAALAEIAYGWVFAASALIGLVALALMRWWVREPRWNAADKSG